jgi:methyltransferase-like protein
MKINETAQYQTYLEAMEVLRNAGYEVAELKCKKNHAFASVRKNSNRCGFLSVTQLEGSTYIITVFDIFNLFGFNGYHQEKKLMQGVIDRGGFVCMPAGSFISGYSEKDEDNQWLKVLGKFLS